MPIVLDHTIVHATDPLATAAFLAQVLGVEPPRRLGIFTVLQVGPTSLDYLPGDGAISPRHFAFKVSEPEFDAIFARLRDAAIPYWADPAHQQSGAINHWDDGRGVYFNDPDGHVLEVITRSYGEGGCEAEHPNPLLNCPPR